MTDVDEPAGLTRVTFNATPAGNGALNTLVERLGMSRTDVLNRAVQVFLLVDEMTRQNNGLRVLDKDGAVERVHIL